MSHTLDCDIQVGMRHSQVMFYVLQLFSEHYGIIVQEYVIIMH